MLTKYILTFLVSMVPIIELRGAIPIAVGIDVPLLHAYIIAVIGNMIPVPFIYLFARKLLVWGADKKIIGPFFSFCLEKGEKGGQKLKNLRKERTLCGSHSFRWNPAAGNRSLDRNAGCQHP